MRRLLVGLAMAGIALSAPCWVLAGEMADQITSTLKTSGQLKGYSIKVTTQGSDVWLDGSVRNQQQLHAAIDIVSNFPGVNKIYNRLRATDGSKFVNDTAATSDSGVRQASAQAGNGQAHYAGGSMADYDAPGTVAGPSQGSGGSGVPLAMGASRMAMAQAPQMMPGAENVGTGTPIPAYGGGPAGGIAPAHFDRPNMPGYSWPSYAAYPNYAAVNYPRQYSATAWPFIGPFYPYPQVPLGWRKVTLEWHNGWWNLDFRDCPQ